MSILDYIPTITKEVYGALLVFCIFYYKLFTFLCGRLSVPCTLVEEEAKKFLEIEKKYGGDDDQVSKEKSKARKETNQLFCEYCWRFCGIAHAFFITVTCLIYFSYNSYEHMYQSEDMFYEGIILANSHAYFIIDTYLQLAGIEPFYWVYMFHHLIIGFLFSPALLFNMYVKEALAMLLIGECTGIFMHARTLFDMNNYNGAITIVNFCIFCILFISVRLYLSFIWIGSIYTGPATLWYKMWGVLVWYIGFMWTWQIMNLWPKKLTELFPNLW